MQVKIYNPNKLKALDYRNLVDLQGTLKDLSQENEEKLKNVLEKRGFRAPIFIYHDLDEARDYIMDGHQRVAVMKKYDMSDNGNHEVPVVNIPADSLKEAKGILLEITSQYGKITKKGLDEYLKTAGLPVAETMEAITYDAIGTGLDPEDVKNLLEVELPFYEPSEVTPEAKDLANMNKTDELVAAIKKMKISDDLKKILLCRAAFFTDFNFDKIADYYASADDATRDIIEKLGLVIIAPRKAIENGFATLLESLEGTVDDD